MEVNLDKVHWKSLSSNENAIHILGKNLDKINWICLSTNPHPNPNAINIFKNNQHKINWGFFKTTNVYNQGRIDDESISYNKI